MIFPENEYPFRVNDRIEHVKSGKTGIVLEIDRMFPHPTTCKIQWDDLDESPCEHWTDRVRKIG